jgi:integrase
MRTKLTPAFVAKATATGKHQAVYWDAAMPGFGLMVTPGGHKSFVVQYRADGKSRRATIKFGPGLEAARREARAIQGSVARGRDPVGEKSAARHAVKTTLRGVVEGYFASEGSKLRSATVRRSAFDRLVLPTLGSRPIGEIRRGEIVALLDKIEGENGAPMASLTLAYLRKVMNWHAVRDETFHTPIVRGMQRGEAVRRDRILSDDELRCFWRATEGQEHPYSRMARLILLTATRRDEAADLQWSEIQGDTWVVPAARYKTAMDMEIPLSAAAQDVLGSMPKIGTKGWVFTLAGDARIGNFTGRKAKLDTLMIAELRKVAAERGEDPEKVTLPRWTIHDLRRTARSLMSRAGVPADHAERCLGHVIGGVRGIYDRHAFSEEKRAAFEALAALVERVLNPAAGNVVPLAPFARKGEALRGNAGGGARPVVW